MKPLRNFVLMPAIAAMMMLLTNAEVGKALTPHELSRLPRVALVIGNSDYSEGKLDNPANDARDIAATLKQLDFDVTLSLNLDKKAMQEAIRSFGNQLHGNKVGLFYYAGHGVQVEGKNYLLPIHANIRCPDEVQYEAVQAELVLAKMESANNPLNLMVLDACRDNPYKHQCQRGSMERGLAGMRPAGGNMMILFSTRPGKSANDGKGRNSPFAIHLRDQMKTPGQGMFQMISRVTDQVEKETGGEQTPWLEGALKSDFYFKPGIPRDEEMWRRVKDSDSPDVLALFIETHPNSRFVSVARQKMERLEAEERERLRQDQEARQKAKQEKYMADSGGTDVVTPEPEKPDETKLTVTSDVGHAVVEINGRDYGKVPGEFSITEAGGYRIRVTAKGYQPYEKTLKLELGQTRTVKAYLEKKGQGRDFTNTLGMKFVLIPPGNFKRDGVQVKITKGFHMQTTEVTQGQWKAVMGNNPSRFKNCGDDCPVERVSWNDVQAFIKKLNRKEGTDRYRLPTEAEWEYAARSGGKAERYAGFSDDDRLHEYANFCDRNCEYDWKDEHQDDGYENTAPVRSFKPNGIGLYDMSGNVWEWCLDIYESYNKATITNPIYIGRTADIYSIDASDIYSDSGSGRVIRGGSWSNDAGLCRSAYRGSSSPGDRYGSIGFRLARTP